MAPLACLMHWYISMLYVVPVLAVGGWGWWSSKRMARRRAAELNATTGEHRPSVPA